MQDTHPAYACSPHAEHKDVIDQRGQTLRQVWAPRGWRHYIETVILYPMRSDPDPDLETFQAYWAFNGTNIGSIRASEVQAAICQYWDRQAHWFFSQSLPGFFFQGMGLLELGNGISEFCTTDIPGCINEAQCGFDCLRWENRDRF